MIAVNSVIIFITLGLLLVIAGFFVKTVDYAKADEMLAFIRENNPGYYECLKSIDDRTYKKEFYVNYTVRGNKRITAAGMMILLLTINTAIPLGYFAHKFDMLRMPELSFSSERGEDGIGLAEEETSVPDNSEESKEAETN